MMDDEVGNSRDGATASTPTPLPRERAEPGAAALGQSLKRVYEAALDEAIPDSMMDLLRKLS